MGILIGSLARVSMLRTDYRQYPTYPHSYTSHLALGFIAALAGAATVAALLESEWTAVTFFLLVSQQFREIRGMERDSLKAMEDDELVPRGSDYIEDIAKVFEARYYIVIGVAAASCYGMEADSIWTGVIMGFLVFAIGASLMKRQRIGDIAVVEPVDVVIKDADIYAGDVYMLNLGLVSSKKIIAGRAIAATLTPKNKNAAGTLSNPGQRQAIVHDVADILGARKDSDTPEFSPMAKRDLASGKLAVYVVPMEKDQDALLEALRRVPVLESARGSALNSRAGRKA